MKTTVQGRPSERDVIERGCVSLSLVGALMKNAERFRFLFLLHVHY